MATAIHGKKTVVGYNGFDLSNMGNMARAQFMKDLAPCECFGDEEHTYEVGQRGQNFSFDGRYKGSQANCRSLFNLINQDTRGLFVYAPDGADAGKLIFVAQAHQTSADVSSDNKSVVSVSSQFVADGGFGAGISLGSPFV